MNQPTETQNPASRKFNEGISNPGGLRWLGLFVLGLSVCIIQPLHQLIKLAFSDDLYSHIPLIPLVSVYLIWTKRRELPAPSAPHRVLAVAFAVIGVIALAVSLPAIQGNLDLTAEDILSLRILSWLGFVGSAAAWLLGRETLRALAFPLCFLIFMVPFPTAVRSGLETFLQYGSAAVAHALFNLGGTSVFYHDLIFRLPGIDLRVAPECSGIRSSLALFITSVVAGHFFLRSKWKCVVLSLAVIPLALLRNGFRIFTIGELCVHISPDMINSYIHRQGGPVFFALSLIPFFLLLWLLLRSEQRPRSSKPTTLL
jgi:exosortase C (VPDSG-CTERM-specific)